MGASYAGDRLQGLAQSWLVATVTGSALAVGGITALGSLPLLLMPLGGVIADRVDRRRLLIGGQLAGAVLTAAIARLAATGRVSVWHIYAWVVLNSLIWLVSRPAYKVVLTEAVPLPEVRSAVAINSMSEMAVAVLVAGAGGVLMVRAGLTVAFVLNACTYLIAAVYLWSLRGLGGLPEARRTTLSLGQVLADLLDGFRYLLQESRLLQPLLLTVLLVAVVSPVTGLLAAIVHAKGRTVVDLGILLAAAGVGAFLGAACAGMKQDDANVLSRYAWLSLLAAGAMAAFAVLPTGPVSLLSLALIGFVVVAQSVWNTSRVRALVAPGYQARLQAITSTVFNVGAPIGMAWGGLAVDHFGVAALLGGAVALAAAALITIAVTGRRRSHLKDG